METQTKVNLTVSEVGNLWSSLLNEEALNRIFQIFHEHCEDQNCKSLIETAINFSSGNQKVLDDLFNQEGLTPPKGFTDQDMDMKAPKLFPDAFYLYYLQFLSKAGLIDNGFAYLESTRNDVVDYYKETVRQSEVIFKSASDILRQKNLPFEPPVLSLSNKVEIVNRQKYLGKYFGSERKLNSLEVSALFSSYINSVVIHQMITGFCQLKIGTELSEWFKDGEAVIEKHKKELQSKMEKENVPVPQFDSIAPIANKGAQPPFSEKLMLIHTLVLCSFISANNGVSASTSLRKDLSLTFAKSMFNINRFSENGAKLLIKKGWLEEPPQML